MKVYRYIVLSTSVRETRETKRYIFDTTTRLSKSTKIFFNVELRRETLLLILNYSYTPPAGNYDKFNSKSRWNSRDFGNLAYESFDSIASQFYAAKLRSLRVYRYLRMNLWVFSLQRANRVSSLRCFQFKERSCVVLRLTACGMRYISRYVIERQRI